MLPINREIYGHENVLPVRSIDQKKIRIRPKKIVLISRTEQSYEIRSFVLNCQMMMLNKKLRSNISKMFNSPLFIFGRRYGRLMPHCFWASLLFFEGWAVVIVSFLFLSLLKKRKKNKSFSSFFIFYLLFVVVVVVRVTSSRAGRNGSRFADVRRLQERVPAGRDRPLHPAQGPLLQQRKLPGDVRPLRPRRRSRR